MCLLTFLHGRRPDPVHRHVTSCVCCSSACSVGLFWIECIWKSLLLTLYLFSTLTNNIHIFNRNAGLAGMRNAMSQYDFFSKSRISIWIYSGTEHKRKEASLRGETHGLSACHPWEQWENTIWTARRGRAGGQAGCLWLTSSVCEPHSDNSEAALSTVCTSMSLTEGEKANSSFWKLEGRKEHGNEALPWVFDKVVCVSVWMCWGVLPFNQGSFSKLVLLSSLMHWVSCQVKLHHLRPHYPAAEKLKVCSISSFLQSSEPQ